MGLIGSIIIGALAGALAYKLMGKESSGCGWNLFLGIIGGFVGGWVFSLLGISWDGKIIGQLGTATVGAVIVLWVYNKLTK